MNAEAQLSGESRATTARANRIAWSFLGGVTVIQAAALLWMFQNFLDKPARLAHYFLMPQPSLLAWALALATTVAYVAYAALRSPFIGEHILSPSRWNAYAALRIVSLAEALVTGVFEEVFFRRFVMDWVAEYGMDAALQIGSSAVVFGLAHGFWGFFTGNVRAGLGASLATGVLGGLLGAVYIVGGRSLLPCIAVHIVINLFLEPWLILASASGSWGRKPADA